MKLNNGLTVIITENHSQPIVSVQVWVKVGSVYEKESQKGLTHFLEHLLFKGSENYPGDEMSRRVESRGGIINAGTSKEFTQYYIDIQKDYAEEAVRLLADTMANAVFPEDEINRERPVVIEEIIRHNDSPGGVLYDRFSGALFTKTPYRDNIIGSSTVIKNVSRKEIMDYYHTWYVPNNMFVTIAGDVDTAKILKVVEGSFGKQQFKELPSAPALKEPEHGPNEEILKKDVEHDYFMAGFLGPDVFSDDQFAADLTSTILGGGRSSRLYRILREEKQLVYTVSSSFLTQHGSGALIFYCVFAPKDENRVLNELKNEINRLASEGPTDVEVARAKEIIKSEWYFDQETFHDQAATMGYWTLQGNPQMPYNYINKINSVNKGNIKTFLKKYYGSQGLTYALLTQDKK